MSASRLRYRSLLLLIVVMLCSVQIFAGEKSNEVTPDEAIQKAKALLKQFQQASAMKDYQGRSTTDEFLFLFSPNAYLPLSFISSRLEESVSPNKFVAEYQAHDIMSPLSTQYELVGKPQLGEVRNDGDRQLTLRLKSILTHGVNEQGIYAPLLEQVVQRLEMQVQVSASGYAKIVRIVPIVVDSRPVSLALDLQYLMNATNNGLRENTGIDGLEDHTVEVRGPSIRLSVGFSPFSASTPGETPRLGIRIAAGTDFLGYTAPEMGVVSKQVDYLEEDQVIELLSGAQLNDAAIGSEDFVLSVNDRFQEEKVNHTAIKASLGLTYRLGNNTHFELAYGLSSGGTVDVTRSQALQVNSTFSEGQFANSPLVVSDGEVTYNGHSIPFQDQENVYGLRGAQANESYALELAGTTYVEIRLIQGFNAGTFGVSGILTVRQHLSSPLPNSGETALDLREVVVEGVPRLVAFTEEFNPMYVGIGLRLQKND